MGLAIERERFTAAEFARYTQRLREQLPVLRELLGRPGFGEGPASIGAEVELHLVDAELQPLAQNQAVLASAHDPRLTLELNRFNLEVNAPPVALAGTPFAALRRDLGSALTVVQTAARAHRARAVMVGILPTLRVAHLADGVLSDAPRYRALSRTLRAMRGEPFVAHIKGRESLSAACDDAALEGANASLQVHLRVAPRELAHAFNAAQLAAAPLLAATGNSPFFDSKSLWDETRIALFQQSVDTRLDAKERARVPSRVPFGQGWLRDPHEQFRDNVALYPALLPVIGDEDAAAVLRAGGVPKLDELRLHQGTVWNWNRIVYDPAEGGHLRIEHRLLPSGPTLIDMVANAALTVGLTLALAEDMEHLSQVFPFAHAACNMQLAAKHGLRAELLWYCENTRSVRPRSARGLLLELLPRAESALTAAGVDAREATELLGIVRERIESGRTGAAVQRALVAQFERTMPRTEALARMLEVYLESSSQDVPVHSWGLDTSIRQAVD
ncbi:MAG: glutamate-cysteine ligase, family 2 [Myxococcaceae bacterium]|nr:glutamate-cysteine ligase, family 2 [Myxococcaceae bacterium]